MPKCRWLALLALAVAAGPALAQNVKITPHGHRR